MIFLIVLAKQDITNPPATGNSELLSWIIGVLIVFIVALFTYFKLELKAVRSELKEERTYIKTEGTKNITTLLDNTHVLKQLIAQNDKTEDKIIEIKQISEATKPIIEDNAKRIIDIKSHLKSGD